MLCSSVDGKFKVSSNHSYNGGQNQIRLLANLTKRNVFFLTFFSPISIFHTLSLLTYVSSDSSGFFSKITFRRSFLFDSFMRLVGAQGDTRL